MKRKNNSSVSTMRTIAKYLAIAFSILVILAISCIGLLLFWITNPYTVCFGTLFPNNEDVTHQARIQFPASSSNITYRLDTYSRSFVDGDNCKLWLQFEIEPTDFEALRNSSLIDRFEPTPLTGDTFDYYLEQMNWSQPENLLAGYGSASEQWLSQWIFIDTEDSERWIVYVVVHDTDYWEPHPIKN